MESCIRISLSEYIDPDQPQRFDHSGRNEIWREPFPPARTCDSTPRVLWCPAPSPGGLGPFSSGGHAGMAAFFASLPSWVQAAAMAQSPARGVDPVPPSHGGGVL